MNARRAVGMFALIAYGVLSLGFCLTREGAVPMILMFGAPALPILAFWWWRARADARRDTRATAELAAATATPTSFVLHELVVELPAERVRALLAEMDCGASLAHRTASALAGEVARGATLSHSAAHHPDLPSLTSTLERERREDAGQSYRGQPVHVEDTPAGGVVLVWRLGAAYVEPPRPRPDERGALSAWLDELVPVVPERTLVSEVRLKRRAWAE